MTADKMTPVERWKAVFRREKPDRMPMDYWGTDEATAALMRHLGCGSREEALRKLQVDYVVKVVPRYAGPELAPNRDAFGRRFRDVDYGAGVYRECVHHPLAGFKSIAEIERNYAWPCPDWWDYADLPGQIRGHETYPIQGGGSEPYLIYKDLRGDEQSLVDFIESPELAHYLLDKLFDLAYEDSRRTFERIPGKVLLAYVAEDMGGQSDLLFSPAHIREFLLPGMKRIIDLAHQAGAYVFHHNDGSCRRIIPDMIDLGIDLLNPLQWRCPGMEREGLKRDFGGRIVLHGGMDNQQTLPFGTVEDVRREVRDNIRILGAGGGYILAPCHNIQPNTPPENVVAMYETGFTEGRTA
jgi:uroporphyrinogen decarboxylase